MEFLEMETHDDEEEAAALVPKIVAKSNSQKVAEKNGAKRKSIHLLLSALLFFAMSLVVLPPTVQTLATRSDKRQGNATATEETSNILGAMTSQLDGTSYPHFTCASEVHKAKNDDPESFEEVYTNVSKHIIHDNVTAFIETFRETSYDGWGKTYNVVKKKMKDWKIKQFADNLNDGDTIFESACGIGLNLVLTLEAIKEAKDLSNITVFGNEYIADSVILANKLLGTLLPQLNASKGEICQGDSTDLSFVPSEAFDLVFTGYLSTLLDPLHFKLEEDKNWEMYEHICETRDDDWESKKLAEIAQQKQEDWFGLWVSEMVRIAKPGKPVIIEQVSPPYCNDVDDWGGVSRNFWKAGVNNYGWDIDPSSIDIAADKVFGSGRYHVFMRKNN